MHSRSLHQWPNPCSRHTPNLKIKLFKFTYCNNKFPLEAKSRKIDKYFVLHLLPTQQSQRIPPPQKKRKKKKIIAIGIRGTIHNSTTKSLMDLHNQNIRSRNSWKPPHKSHKIPYTHNPQLKKKKKKI